MFPKRRRLAAVLMLLALYLAGLVWGYFRLPWAALSEIVLPPIVTLDQIHVSPAQLRYLETRVTDTDPPMKQIIQVSVEWNALACARVSTGLVLGPTGGHWRDGLYICVFGGWVRVYTFSEIVS